MKKLLLLLTYLTITWSSFAQDYSDSISVNFFLLDECRITQNMSGEIRYIFEHYNEAPFTFIGYFPNQSSKVEKLDAFMEYYNIPIPYQTDYHKEKAKYYEATIAPEVVVYDEKKQEILYKGRIDNSYDKVGSKRRVTTSRDLRLALEAILADQAIEQPRTQAIGCYINYNESN